MAQAEDLVGQRFGSLTVIKRCGSTSSGNAQWTCKCDCGVSWLNATGSSLRAGRTSACGLCSCRLILNQKIGKITPIGIAEHTKKGRKLLCLCDCGTEFTAYLSFIKNGLVVGCKYCRTTDLRGKRFGKLTVVDLAPQPEGAESSKARWLCKCACGNEKVVRTDYLRSRRTKSCGCWSLEKKQTTGIRTLWGQVIAKHHYTATARQIESQLSDEQVIAICSRDCHYCGCAPNKRKVLAGQNDGSIYLCYHGMDRIDSSLSYTVENVVTCCSRCNFAKGTMGYAEFKEWISRVYRHMFRSRTAAQTDYLQLPLVS